MYVTLKVNNHCKQQQQQVIVNNVEIPPLQDCLNPGQPNSLDVTHEKPFLVDDIEQTKDLLMLNSPFLMILESPQVMEGSPIYPFPEPPEACMHLVN